MALRFSISPFSTIEEHTMRNKFSKIAFVAGFSLALAFTLNSCASTARQEEPVAECLSGEFRGFGVGENENEALVEARSALAGQVSSSINVTIKRIVSQQTSNGKEDLNTVYDSRATIESSLSNAHDARIVRNKRNGNKINIVVCMTKADAAKGFLERQRLLLDSLGLSSDIALSTEHPKHKNEAWRKTQMLYNDFMRIQRLLDGWEVKSPYSAEEIYSKTREDYKNYCQSVKVFWQDAGNECSKAVFAILSKKIKMEKSQCSGGLNLNFNCSEKCKPSSFGIECSYEPSLSIESCDGESYSLLKAQTPAAGSDMYSEAKAKENLAENLPKATFFAEWEIETKKLVPQCVD